MASMRRRDPAVTVEPAAAGPLSDGIPSTETNGSSSVSTPNLTIEPSPPAEAVKAKRSRDGGEEDASGAPGPKRASTSLLAVSEASGDELAPPTAANGATVGGGDGLLPTAEEGEEGDGREWSGDLDDSPGGSRQADEDVGEAVGGNDGSTPPAAGGGDDAGAEAASGWDGGGGAAAAAVGDDGDGAAAEVEGGGGGSTVAVPAAAPAPGDGEGDPTGGGSPPPPESEEAYSNGSRPLGAAQGLPGGPTSSPRASGAGAPPASPRLGAAGAPASPRMAGVGAPASPRAPGVLPGGAAARRERREGGVAGAGSGTASGGAAATSPRQADHSDTIRVPMTLVGKVIGRAGESIRQMQERTGTRIQVDHDTPGNEKVVTVFGKTRESVARAMRELREVNASEEANSVIECPQGAVGRIIGRGGETIRALQSASQAHITVDQNFPEGVPRKLLVSGTPEACRRAAAMLRELMTGEPGTAQQVIQRVCREQGIGSSHVLSVPKDLVGKIIGRGGETIKAVQRATQATIQIDQLGDPCQVTVAGQPEAADAAKHIIEEIVAGGDPLGVTSGVSSAAAASAVAAAASSVAAYGPGPGAYAPGPGAYGPGNPYGHGGPYAAGAYAPAYAPAAAAQPAAAAGPYAGRPQPYAALQYTAAPMQFGVPPGAPSPYGGPPQSSGTPTHQAASPYPGAVPIFNPPYGAPFGYAPAPSYAPASHAAAPYGPTYATPYGAQVAAYQAGFSAPPGAVAYGIPPPGAQFAQVLIGPGGAVVPTAAAAAAASQPQAMTSSPRRGRGGARGGGDHGAGQGGTPHAQRAQNRGPGGAAFGQPQHGGEPFGRATGGPEGGPDRPSQAAPRPPLPTHAAWQELKDEAGRSYFYDSQNGVTQWERPAELGQAT